MFESSTLLELRPAHGAVLALLAGGFAVHVSLGWRRVTGLAARAQWVGTDDVSSRPPPPPHPTPPHTRTLWYPETHCTTATVLLSFASFPQNVWMSLKVGQARKKFGVK